MPKAAAIFPLRDLWLPLLPALPLVLAATLLSGLLPSPDPGAPAAQSLASLMPHASKFSATPEAERNYNHLGDILTYCALASVHTLLCLGVIATFAHWMRRLPARGRQGALVFLGTMVVLAIAIVAFFAGEANSQVLVLLGYKAVCQLIAAAELPTDLVGAEECFAEGTNTLTWLAWIPTFAGIATVAFAAAFAYAATRNPDTNHVGQHPDDPTWRESLERRIQDLQRSVYLLSAVLVSSTVTISVFAHLPASLFTNEKGLVTAVSKFATGLSTYWGAMFSMTLVATFIAPALRLIAEAYGAETAAREGAHLRQWLHDHVFQSIKHQFGTVLSLMAPLLVGPLSSLLSSLSGF